MESNSTPKDAVLPGLPDAPSPPAPTACETRNDTTHCQTCSEQTRYIINSFETIARPRAACAEIDNWKLKFDGKIDPIAFLEDIEIRSAAAKISKEQLLAALPYLLTGTPYRWYQNNHRNWGTWDDFIKTFKRTYAGNNYERQLEEVIFSRKQRAHEKAFDYITDLQVLIRRLGKHSLEEELTRIYQNMQPEYRQYIRRRDFQTVEELTEQAQEYEQLQEEARRLRPVHVVATPDTTPVATATPPRSRRADTAVCWRCRQPGHFQRTCTNPVKLVCLRCNQVGVRTRDCQCHQKPSPGNAA